MPSVTSRIKVARRLNARSPGFTIVELLIVIVVIAILAAISFVAYVGVQDSAWTSVIKSDLESSKKALLLYAIRQGKFPSTLADMTPVGLKASKPVYDTAGNNFYYCHHNLTDQFALGVRTLGNKGFVVTSTNGVTPVAGITASKTCQQIGLAGDSDADVNAWDTSGYTTSSGWKTWL